MKLTGMSRESADILGDVVGTDEYNAVPTTTDTPEDGNFSEDSIATEDGNAGEGVEGEATENVIEDQDDLDLENDDGGEYDSSEVGAEDGDAVDGAFDAIGGGTDDISEDTGDGEANNDTAGVDAETDEGDAGATGDEGTDDTDVGGAEDTGDGDDTSVGGNDDISVDTGVSDDGTVAETEPSEPTPVASDVPVESTDTDDSGLTDEQVKQGSEAVESYFQVIDRRAARSFEDGADTILDEPEVANADLPVPEDDGLDTGDVGAAEDTTDDAVNTGDGADVGGDVGGDATDTEVETDTEIEDLGTESLFDLF